MLLPPPVDRDMPWRLLLLACGAIPPADPNLAESIRARSAANL